MQRESYRNPAIAAMLNKYSVAIKADRELSPALDTAPIACVERTRGQDRW